MLTPKRLGRVLLLALVGPLLACSKTAATAAPHDGTSPEPPPASAPEGSVAREPDEDSKRVEARAASLACAEDKIARYNEERDGDDGEALLFEAARCFEDAGVVGSAIHSLRAMVEHYPDGAHRAEGLARLVELFGMVEAEDGARGTPQGDRCLRGIDAATLKGSTAALELAATCLYDAAFLGSALAVRIELAKRSLSAEERLANAKAIDEIQSGLERLRARNEAWLAALPPPAPTPNATASPAEDAPAPAAGPPALPLTAKVPAFAKLGYRAEKRNKLRAIIVDIGAAYAPQSLTRLDIAGQAYGVLLTVPVLDPDQHGNPRRPRVVCDGRTTRVGLALDGTSFATVTRTQAFVSPDRQRPAKIGAKTPGVRLSPGRKITASDSSDGTTKIDYRGLFLEVTGFVPSDAVDLVFEPGELANDGVRDGRLLRNVEFLDAPHGRPLARTQRSPGIANELYVRTLGSTNDGHVLVRYHESDAFVVGWIPVDDVETFPRRTFRGGSGGGSGYGSGGTANTIELPRGTLLVAPGSAEVIGVITKDDRFFCGDTCSDQAPRIKLRSCGHRLEAHAVPSDAVRPER